MVDYNDVIEALETLGLDDNFTPEDLKKAFRNKSKEFHPDNLHKVIKEKQLNEEEAQKLSKEYTEQTKKITNAKSILTEYLKDRNNPRYRQQRKAQEKRNEKKQKKYDNRVKLHKVFKETDFFKNNPFTVEELDDETYKFLSYIYRLAKEIFTLKKALIKDYELNNRPSPISITDYNPFKYKAKDKETENKLKAIKTNAYKARMEAEFADLKTAVNTTLNLFISYDILCFLLDDKSSDNFKKFIISDDDYRRQITSQATKEMYKIIGYHDSNEIKLKENIGDISKLVDNSEFFSASKEIIKYVNEHFPIHNGKIISFSDNSLESKILEHYNKKNPSAEALISYLCKVYDKAKFISDTLKIDYFAYNKDFNNLLKIFNFPKSDFNILFRIATSDEKDKYVDLVNIYSYNFGIKDTLKAYLTVNKRVINLSFINTFGSPIDEYDIVCFNDEDCKKLVEKRNENKKEFDTLVSSDNNYNIYYDIYMKNIKKYKNMGFIEALDYIKAKYLYIQKINISNDIDYLLSLSDSELGDLFAQSVRDEKIDVIMEAEIKEKNIGENEDQIAQMYDKINGESNEFIDFLFKNTFIKLVNTYNHYYKNRISFTTEMYDKMSIFEIRELLEKTKHDEKVFDVCTRLSKYRVATGKAPINPEDFYEAEKQKFSLLERELEFLDRLSHLNKKGTTR